MFFQARLENNLTFACLILGNILSLQHVKNLTRSNIRKMPRNGNQILTINMKKKIEVSKDVRLFIQKVFGVTDVMIWKALTFESESELSRRIRHLATERGGRTMLTLPEDEVFYTHDGRMIRTLRNGRMIEIKMETGACEVFHKGEMVKQLNIVTIPELNALVAELAAL